MYLSPVANLFPLAYSTGYLGLGADVPRMAKTLYELPEVNSTRLSSDPTVLSVSLTTIRLS